MIYHQHKRKADDRIVWKRLLWEGKPCDGLLNFNNETMNIRNDDGDDDVSDHLADF